MRAINFTWANGSKHRIGKSGTKEEAKGGSKITAGSRKELSNRGTRPGKNHEPIRLRF
jgi:hypothetical protein